MKKLIVLLFFTFLNLYIYAQCVLPGAAGPIVGYSSVCPTQVNAPYTIAKINNAQSYVWRYTGQGITIQDSLSSTFINFLATATSGTLTVSGRNQCGEGAPSPNYVISVIPFPDSSKTITGSVSVCQGQSTVFYSVPTIANADFYSWEYSGTGALISGSTNSITIDFTSTATSGKLTVKGNGSCGVGKISPDFSITINEVPQGIFSGNSVCVGDSKTGKLLWASSAGDEPFTVTYHDGTANRTKSNVFGGIAFDPFTTPSATTGYKLINVSNQYCSRSSNFTNDSATIAVTSQSVTINAHPNDTVVCEGGTTLFAIQTEGAYAYQWEESTDNGNNFNPITTSGTIPFYSNFKTPTLTVSKTQIAHNGYKYRCSIIAACGNDTVSLPAKLIVQPIPGAAGIISGPERVCQKQNGAVFTVPPISNATKYIWSFSGKGATLTTTSNTVTINFSVIASSGYLKVKGISDYCEGASSEEYPVLVVIAPSSAGSITGTNSVCQNQKNVAYQIPIFHKHSTFDEPTFTWNYTGSGISISGTTNPMTIDFSDSATSGILTVRRTQYCGFGQVSPNYSITVNPAPKKPSAIIGTDSVCQPGQISYSVNPVLNATKYFWNYTGNAINIPDTSNSVSIPFSTNSTSGMLTVKASVGKCESLSSDSLHIFYGDCTTGILESTVFDPIQIYPNPSTGIINILLPEDVHQSYFISVINVLGKEVYSLNKMANINTPEQQINLSNLAKGIYYLNFHSQMHQKSFKIVLQ